LLIPVIDRGDGDVEKAPDRIRSVGHGRYLLNLDALHLLEHLLSRLPVVG
jgi:hypothetical protein